MSWLKPNKFWYAVAVMVASTIGVGFYGIPFTFAKAGLTAGLLFFFGVVGMMLLVNLLMGEVVLRTHQRHQFVGYVNRYLGVWAKRINLFIFWVSTYGALIGVIIISGDFLSNILSPYLNFSTEYFSTLFIIIASILVFVGLKTVSKFDLIAMSVVIIAIIGIGLLGISHVSINNYNFSFSDFWFLPFGVILFSLHSVSIPMAREMLIGSERSLKKVIIYGTLVPAGLYLFFSIVVLGISGDMTSPEAITGLFSFIGSKILFMGSLVGFITSSTIFLNISTALKESLQEDFKIKHRWMWILAMLPPYLLFLMGVRNFIDIIGLVGGVAVSLQTILLIFMYVKAKRSGDRIPEYSIRLPVWSMYLLMAVFATAAIYTIWVK
jgi:tyrosine-specific transport protein